MLPLNARQALECWLAYDETRRSLTSRMFAGRESPEDVQHLLEENERLRLRAVELTRQLLYGTSAGEETIAQ